MHYISLTQQEGLKGAHEEALLGKIVEAPLDITNEGSKVKSKEGAIEAHEEKE